MDSVLALFSSPAFWQGLAAVIGGFAVLATLTPNKADNVVLDALLKAVNALAMNFGKARNR